MSGWRMARRWLVPAVAGALALTPLGVPAAHAAVTSSSVTSSTEATSYQIGPAHDGYQPGDNLTLPLAQSWTADLGGQVSYPVVTGGRVFAVSTDDAGASELWAFDVASGSVLWGPLEVSEYGLVGLAYDAGRVDRTLRQR